MHGLGPTGDAPELMAKYGGDTVKLLWDSVSRKTVQWLRSLDFGFFELDCLLIHGSTVSVDDELTPETPPIQMLDRLSRMQANNLFCGRSGLTFQYQLQTGSITSALTTLDNQASPQTVTVAPRQVIGVGNVGRTPGQGSTRRRRKPGWSRTMPPNCWWRSAATPPGCAMQAGTS